jgi:hypothetical protein
MNINIPSENVSSKGEVCSQTYAISFEQDAVVKPYKTNSITIRDCSVA